jgi:uncharacterized protein
MRFISRYLKSKIFIVLLILLSPYCQAADILFGNVLPDGAMFHKQLNSMKEQPFHDMIRQHTDFTCGAAALATILKYAFGYRVSEAAVMHGLLKMTNPVVVRERGFSLLDIKNYVERIGLHGKGYIVEPHSLWHLKIPAIALLDIKGYKHFVVIRRALKDKVYVADPALGNRVIDMEDFEKQWTGPIFVVMGEDYNSETALLRPHAGPSARRLLDPNRLMPDVLPVDFGFIPTGLF